MGPEVSVEEVRRLHKGIGRLTSFVRRRRKLLASFSALLALGSIVGFIAVGTPAIAKANLDLEQCANLDSVCDSTHPAQWQNGNLNHNNSKYVEGQSIPYRSIIDGLTPGATYQLLIEWDTTQSGKHAIDYLTSFDRTVTNADPCVSVTCGASSTLAIPNDPNVTGAGVVPPAGQVFTAYGATFPTPGTEVSNTGNLCGAATCTVTSNPTPFLLTGDYGGASHTSTRVYFTATSTTAVLSWGGHIATRLDWGVDGSAVSISGSPYHMRVHEFTCSDTENCSVGNMDRSLESAAVVFGASITVTKQATKEGPTSFGFTAGPAPLGAFNLVDDGTNAATRSFTGITDFTTYTVAEQGTTGWILQSIDCSTGAPNGGSWHVDGGAAVIDLREGENVTCTFTNSPAPVRSIDLTKTAAPTKYVTAGDVITYTYVVTNPGETAIGPTQFTITDNRIDEGLPFACGPAATTLVVGGSVTCTHDYVVTAADIDAGTVVNTAAAGGDGLTSPVRTATVTRTVVPPTSTTTTTTEPTTTTTTTLPGTTTTFAATATTPPATTTSSSTSTSTTSTSTTTSVPKTTTTAAAPELQVIGVPTTSAPESDFLVLFPNELPRTGRSVNWILIIGAALLIVVGSVVGFANNRSNNKKGTIR